MSYVTSVVCLCLVLEMADLARAQCTSGLCGARDPHAPPPPGPAEVCTHLVAVLQDQLLAQQAQMQTQFSSLQVLLSTQLQSIKLKYESIQDVVRKHAASLQSLRGSLEGLQTWRGDLANMSLTLNSHVRDVSALDQRLHRMVDHCPSAAWVRLVNGTEGASGRLEVLHAGKWGTVCDDNFDQYDARAFCQSLCLPWTNATVVSPAHFGPGQGPVWLDDIDCAEDARSAAVCTHAGWGRSNCGHAEDVGIRCT